MFRTILSLWTLAFHGITVTLLALRRRIARKTTEGGNLMQMEILPPSEVRPQPSEAFCVPETDTNATKNGHDIEGRLPSKPPRPGVPGPVVEGKICTSELPEIGLSASQVHNQVLDIYPNDLTRLIYLASLRDCNSGMYRHPTLCRKYTTEATDSILRLCHEQVFARVLALPVDDYVRQLKGYIRFSNVDRSGLIKTWNTLQAYRTVIPVKITALETKIFVSNITLALGIVESGAAPSAS